MVVLITGAGGFIGSHLLDEILENTGWDVVCTDSFRHKGTTDRIARSPHYLANRDRVRVFTHDLCAPLSPSLVSDMGPVDIVFSVASESHVDRSIEDPVRFVKNNVDLALNMLEYARVVQPRAFFQISTDEVYGPAHDGECHDEWSPILPSNPYAASKAAQEAIAISYWRTYGVPLVLTNTMNNFGPAQDSEKFVPKIIDAVLGGKTLTIHGAPGNIGSRFYMHARNHASALVYLAHSTPASYPDAERPDRYNVVGEREVDNLAMASLIATILGRPLKYELVDFHAARPGHDRRYALDGRKMAATGWRPPLSFEDSLRKTVEWYAKKEVLLVA